MSLPSRLLGANPSIQVSTLLSGSLTTPSAKQAFIPPPQDFDSIATSTIVSPTADIEFASIPQTYTHLSIRFIARVTAATVGNHFKIVVNSDTTASNYISSGWYWYNGSGTAFRAVDLGEIQRANGANAGSQYFGAGVGTFIDYKRTDKTKIYLSEVGGALDGTAGNSLVAFSSSMEYQSTSAITTLKFTPVSGNWATGTVIALYGIKE